MAGGFVNIPTVIPSQTGNSGLFLTTDGVNLSWGSTSGSPTGAAGGDLSGTYPNPSVATVGTSTAANIHAAEALVNGAQSGNKVFASPSNGSSGAPAFRALVAADVPVVAPLSGTLSTRDATTGTDGQMFWTTSYHSMFIWVNNRWWPFGKPDPRYGFVLQDDFSSTASLSQLDWNANGAGALGNTGTDLGVFYVEQSTASARAFLMTYTAGIAFGTADYYMEAMIQIPTLATSGEDFCAMIGFNDNLNYDANSACTDGAYFTLNRAVNTTKWITNTASNSTTTSTSTNTAVVAGTWYRLGILVSQTNSNVVFSVNGTAIATHTTNIPSGAARSTGVGYKLDKTAGTSASDIYTNYFALYGFFTGGARVS